MAGDPIGVPDWPVGIAVADGTVAVASRGGAAVDPDRRGDGRASRRTRSTCPPTARRSRSTTVMHGSPCPTDSSVMKVPLDGGRALSGSRSDRAPFGVASDGSSVWVAQPEARQVTSIAIADSTAVHRRASPGSAEPTELTVSEGTVWVVDRERRSVFRFATDDTEEQESSGSARTRRAWSSATVRSGSPNTDAGNVVRLSPDRRRTGRGRGRRGAALVAYGFGKVWVANGAGRLDVIDPADGQLGPARSNVPGSPEGVAVGSDQVWVTTGDDGDSVVPVDPAPLSPRTVV